MDGTADDYLHCEPMLAGDLAASLSRYGEADVTVRIAGTFLDVYRMSVDVDREKIVLHLHPDDVADVLCSPTKQRAT